MKKEIIGTLGGVVLGIAGQSLEKPAPAAKEQSDSVSSPEVSKTDHEHHATHAILNPKMETPQKESPSFGQLLSPDALNSESTELSELFAANLGVSERYFDLVDHLTTTPLPNGATRFAVPGTDFDLTLRVVTENGTSWAVCEGTGCVDYGESFVDGKTELTQVGWRTEVGPHTQSVDELLNSPTIVEDFQHLLAGYARADLSGASNPLASTDTALEEAVADARE